MTLLAAYNFDEASGDILDSSGNARTVTFGGSLTRVTGHTNTGISQSAPVLDSPGPSLTGMQTAAFTIMGWIKRTVNSPDGWLMEYKQSASGDRGILMAAPNIQARVKNVAGTVFTAAVAQPTAGTVYHAAATCDGSFVKLFINGAEVASTAFSGGVRTNSTSSSFIDGLGSETWLDDARYYDTALDAATITTAMNTPVASGASFSGSVALSGSGQLAGTGKPAIPGALGLSGAGSASDTGTPGLTGTLAANGAGTVSATGQPALPGSLPLTGGGALALAGAPSVLGSVGLVGAGALGLQATPGLKGDLLLAGAGQFAVSAPVGPVIPGRLAAGDRQSLTATDRYSVLTATTEPTSRLEASDGV